jgi:hypothetical protein
VSAVGTDGSELTDVGVNSSTAAAESLVDSAAAVSVVSAVDPSASTEAAALSPARRR